MSKIVAFAVAFFAMLSVALVPLAVSDPAAFTIRTALGRFARDGDPWADVLAHKHDLRALAERA